MKKWLPILAVIGAMLIWSASGIAIKQALLVLHPMTLIVIRFTIAVLLVLTLGCIVRKVNKESMFALVPLRKQDIRLFLMGGIMQPFLYFILETFSYKWLASPTIAEAMLSTSPLLAPFFAALLLKERITKYNIWGIVISSVGMLMLVMMGSDNFALGNPWGIPMAFATVSTAVLYTIVLRKIPDYYNSLSTVFYMQVVSLLFFYPLWGIVDHGTLMEQADAFLAGAVASTLWSVAYLSILSSVVAFVLFCYSTRIMGVTNTNAFNNIRPVFTALIMLFAFSEHLPWGKWLGIAFIILGLFICQKRENAT